jgi:YfiH family protein
VAETALPVLDAGLGPEVAAFFTGRSSGRARGRDVGLEDADFNLALHVGDDPDRVAGRRRRLAERTGTPVIFARQVHGTRVAVVDERSAANAFVQDLGQDEGGYDAMTTTRPGVAVGVLVADCVPVLLADPVAAVVGAAHAGRKGLLAGVLDRLLEAMAEVGARPERIRAALGPSAGGCCYEVPEQMQREAAGMLPATRSWTRAGTPSLDLRAGCRSVLEAAGVSRVVLVGGCTIEDRDLYSYRRDPVTGRFAGVVMMAP